ncbi:MAG: mechanosensitive ion channel, partial [Planctomycetes bacterium]|nr:mechanosensitive ion channel [Planctomycetota bacterium]
FCTAEMVEKFRKFECIGGYIEGKEKELAEYNTAEGVDESVLVNGRRMTNVGTFRAYVAAYLRNHPMVNLDMTFMVRQLAPTAQGLPIQVYVFCKDQRWVNYEGIQGDIFDHILAVIPQFGLRVFQEPAGADFNSEFIVRSK